MRILVRTFPPSSNANYGGILQAWALQHVLRRMGHDVATDATRTHRKIPWAQRAISSAKTSVKWALSHLGVEPYRSQKAIDLLVKSEVFEFPRQRIAEVGLYKDPRQPDRVVLSGFDAFVVGSDQVWRPEMMNVSSNLMSFLEPSDPRPRVAYAASFGVSTADAWSPRLVAETAVLARMLTAVSVRESSGVDLCHSLWNINASRQADPTMLIEPEDYLAMCDDVPFGGLSVYILDRSGAIEKLIAELSRALQVEAYELNPKPPRTLAEFTTAPSAYVRPGVETWLARIAHADYVVTDSYHGTVFAILFNRPFLAIVNSRRGAARFETLLNVCGLQNRVAKMDGRDAERMAEPIAWKPVNETIRAERDRGLRFLDDALGGQQQP